MSTPRLIRPLAGSADAPGSYLGSIALADALLPEDAGGSPSSCSRRAPRALADGLAARGRRARVTVGDGPRGVVDVAQPGDLVLSAFEALAGRSVATLLWYPLEQPDEPAHWTLGVRGRLDGQLWQLTFSSGEADAGLAGCGLLAAHVSDETEAALTKLSVSLGQALARKRVGLVVEVVQSRNAAGSIS